MHFDKTVLKVLTFRLLRTSLKLCDTTLGFQQGLVWLAGSSGAWARAQNPQVNAMKMHFILLNRYFLVESSLP